MACNNQDLKTTENTPSGVITTTRTNSVEFNSSLKPVLITYYELKDSFITENDLLIDSSAKKLVKAIDSLKLNEIKDDSTLSYTAKTYIGGIKAELIGLLGEKLRNDKMKSFQMVREQLFDLIRIIQYDGEIRDSIDFKRINTTN